MTRYHNINGKLIAFTAEEETARETEEAASLKERKASQYIRNRQYAGAKTYPQVTEQLDQLFRDITAGKFGNDAKTGEWDIAIKKANS